MSTAKCVSPPLRVDRLETGARRLVRPLSIDLGVDLSLAEGRYEGFSRSQAKKTVVTVPAGYDTDFSSIPPVFRIFYRFDSVDLAGCCHDWAYHIGVPRPPADRMWRIVAMSGKRRVGPVRGWLGWAFLRLFGGFVYAPAEPETHAEGTAPQT